MKLAAVVAAVVLLSGCNPEAEATNLAALNALRASVGVSELVRTDEANMKAWRQADAIAEAGHLFHTSDWYDGVAPGWTAMAENVAVSDTVEHAMAALERSPSHYANMTNPEFNEVGIGVTVDANGMVWLCQFFIARPNT